MIFTSICENKDTDQDTVAMFCLQYHPQFQMENVL